MKKSTLTLINSVGTTIKLSVAPALHPVAKAKDCVIAD